MRVKGNKSKNRFLTKDKKKKKLQTNKDKL